jgi:hypothetical protein
MTIRRKDPSSSSIPVKLSPEQVRAKIIEEILSTEQDYVKHLEDIIEVCTNDPYTSLCVLPSLPPSLPPSPLPPPYIQGYLKRCLEYNTLFDQEQIEVIFSNVDKIYDFQKDFLRELKTRIRPGHMAEAEIGEVFVLNVSICTIITSCVY